MFTVNMIIQLKGPFSILMEDFKAEIPLQIIDLINIVVAIF